MSALSLLPEGTRPRPLAEWRLQEICNAPTLERLEWALSRAAAPCPPLSASGHLEHTLATAYRDPARAELVVHQSASKAPG